MYELAPWFVDLAKLFIAPLTGAGAGALAAQGIAKRSADTQRDLAEARATNLAISTTATLVGAIAILKKQHVAPMSERFGKLCAELEQAKKERRVFEFESDFGTLPKLVTGLPMLEKLLYERVSAPPSAMGLFAHLAQSVGYLAEVIEQRNRFIAEMQSDSQRPHDRRAQIYFGLPDKNGDVDGRHPALINALRLYTDDTILFGSLLAKELVKHAQTLNPRGKRRGFPATALVNFTRIEELGLVPAIGETEAQLLAALGVSADLPVPRKAEEITQVT